MPENTAPENAVSDPSGDTANNTATDAGGSSAFDNYGGYYSVRFDGYEVARFAPSDTWSDYAKAHRDEPGFSYAWVAHEIRPAADTSVSG